jgi:AcrR family transcriptional regulator
MTEEPGVSRSEQTRINILQAAYDLFLDNGFHGTSMRQIAERAGIALGGIYNHFASKEDIFTAVVLRYHPINKIMPALDRAGGDSAENLLRSAIQQMVEQFNTHPEIFNMFFIELVEFKGRHIPTVLSAFLPHIMAFANRLVPHAAEMRQIPIPILLRVLISMILAYILTEKFLGVTFPQEFRQGSQHYFMDIFLHGVLRKEGENE